MAEMKTPGVYIVEKDAFPNSVVSVPTAVPAFIGYTEKALNGSKSLLNKPMRISSLTEYMTYFGRGPVSKFELAALAKAAEAPKEESTSKDQKEDDEKVEAVVSPSPKLVVKGTGYTFEASGTNFRMWNSIRWFFQNGGGPCYIVSVGDYSSDMDATLLAGIDKNDGKGLATLLKETEPTMIVVPDAVSLQRDECNAVQAAMLLHCGDKMKSRIAILDVYDGYKDRQDPDGDPIADFRNDVGINFLDYATAYYPWLETSVVQAAELGLHNFSDESLKTLKSLLSAELLPETVAPVEAEGTTFSSPKSKSKGSNPVKTKPDPRIEDIREKVNMVETKDLKPDDRSHLEKALITLSPAYNELILEMRSSLNLMAPSAAMAGIYTLVDNNRGVWKAPANVSVNGVVKPAVNISHDDQEDLNVTPMGKSVNAIRSFIGEGTLVWGARTLDGNSQDWKYLNVRRTMIMLEQSVKNAAKAFVFEPNDANTWVSVKGMIDNFLNGLWKQGALVGSKPEQAYQTTVGLGATMTGNDILDGIMRISVLVAMSRPAEFIEITFQQKMQEA